MKRKRIGILLHKDDAAFIYFKYLIKLLMKEWKSLGHSIELIRGTDRFVPADIVISHVDLTVVPDEYKEFLAQYPCVINRNVPDISKSRISGSLVGRDDPYTGPVIVKTDRNSGGFPEARMVGRRHLFRALANRLAGASSFARETAPVAWAAVRRISSGDYPVFSSLQDVPPAIFDNRNLVIEKFMPEVAGDSYHIRYYHFLGDKEITQRYQSKEKVVKASTSIGYEIVPTPPELREMRKEWGLQYGKIDYVMHDGSVIVLDVNPTPGLPSNDPLGRRIAQCLADGIGSQPAL
jgi:hypothetical protein